MKLLRLLLFQVACVQMFAADPVVTMNAVRVSPSDITLRARCNTEDEIEALTVIAVKPGSTAEKIGIREGDRLTINGGISVAGQKLNTIYSAKGFKLKGQLKFEGHRGFLRKAWSVTVETQTLMEKKKPNPTPQPILAPRADSP